MIRLRGFPKKALINDCFMPVETRRLYPLAQYFVTLLTVAAPFSFLSSTGKPASANRRSALLLVYKSKHCMPCCPSRFMPDCAWLKSFMLIIRRSYWRRLRNCRPLVSTKCRCCANNFRRMPRRLSKAIRQPLTCMRSFCAILDFAPFAITA